MDVHGPIEIRCGTLCPGGVSDSESATNDQCGLTLFRKCHSHNTQEWILAAERIENRFWQNKRLIYRTYYNKVRMMIVLMTNSVLYETFDGHRSFFIFDIFRAQEPKAPVTYCDHALSGVRRPSVVRRPSSIRLFTFSTSSPEPLDGFWWNLVWMKYLRSLTSVVVFRPDPSRGGSRAGQKQVTGGPLLQETSSSDRKATATNRMHSSDLETFAKKCCYFWFHSKVKFLTRFWRLFGLSQICLI